MELPAGPSLRDAAAARYQWWRHGVIYHVYPRSFADANGDGVGDLRGIIDRLDYLNDGTLRSLGVTALWLSPIYPSPGRDTGYDVADHTAIDPVFGSDGDFDLLLVETRRRGIRVILDLVLNHTSDLHPWFLDSRSGRASERRDWYVWRDPARTGRPPNNWLSYFGGPAWTLDQESGQYYLHTFLPEQPDLNWHNPAVRAACLDIARHWLDRGVSGFRLDVFNAYIKHPDLPDNPRRLGLSPWQRQHHLYNRDRPELHDVLAELRALLANYPDTVAIGETFEGDPELAASYCDTLHMVFNFHFMQQPWKARAFQEAIARWDSLLRKEHTWPSYVLSNHDNPRHATRYGRGLSADEADARAKVAAALLLTVRGTPFIYYGEEIGLRDGEIHEAELLDRALRRDPARTPMHWNDQHNAGFSPGVPWLRIGADAHERNVAAQDQSRHSILNFYRQLIWLRHECLALQHGSWEPLARKPRAVLAYLRRHRDQDALVVLNFAAKPSRLILDSTITGRQWIPQVSTHRAEIGQPARLANAIELGPYEATIFASLPEAKDSTKGAA